MQHDLQCAIPAAIAVDTMFQELIVPGHREEALKTGNI